jgi:hypothetical protein
LSRQCEVDVHYRCSNVLVVWPKATRSFGTVMIISTVQHTLKHQEDIVTYLCGNGICSISRFKSSLELMLCVIDISTLNKTYLIWFWVQTLSQVDQLLPVWATFWSYQLSVFPVHTTTYCGFDREQHWSHASEDRPLVYS